MMFIQLAKNSYTPFLSHIIVFIMLPLCILAAQYYNRKINHTFARRLVLMPSNYSQ